MPVEIRVRDRIIPFEIERNWSEYSSNGITNGFYIILLERERQGYSLTVLGQGQMPIKINDTIYPSRERALDGMKKMAWSLEHLQEKRKTHKVKDKEGFTKQQREMMKYGKMILR